jgi:hypothetical protein
MVVPRCSNALSSSHSSYPVARDLWGGVRPRRFARILLIGYVPCYRDGGVLDACTWIVLHKYYLDSEVPRLCRLGCDC